MANGADQMFIQQVDVEKISVVWNSRQDALNTDLLEESVSRIGLLAPIVVMDMGFGQPYRLVCGHRRLHAVRNLKWNYVPARILPQNESEAEIRLMNVSENVARKDLRLYDVANAVTEIHSKFGTSEEWIAKSTGLPLRRVKRILAVWPRLSTTVKERWSKIESADQEPRLSQLEEWSTLSWSEQNRSWKLWANDEDTPEDEDPISDSKKSRKRVKRRTKREVNAMIGILGGSKYDEAQRRALLWAMGKRSTL